MNAAKGVTSNMLASDGSEEIDVLLSEWCCVNLWSGRGKFLYVGRLIHVNNTSRLSVKSVIHQTFSESLVRLFFLSVRQKSLIDLYILGSGFRVPWSESNICKVPLHSLYYDRRRTR